jgi:hypothetical protein
MCFLSNRELLQPFLHHSMSIIQDYPSHSSDVCFYWIVIQPFLMSIIQDYPSQSSHVCFYWMVTPLQPFLHRAMSIIQD